MIEDAPPAWSRQIGPVLQLEAGLYAPEVGVGESELEGQARGDHSIDADGYQEQWDRLTLGVNAFVNQHNLKFQLNYYIDENFLGVRNDDTDSIQFQAQYFF